MKIIKVANRGLLFTFNELNKPPYNCITNVYVIVGKNNFIICDTYLGKFYMKDIKQYLVNNYGNKNYIVFNSHSHWDHVWGNISFKNSKIIAHNLCKENMVNESDEDIKNNIAFAKEEVKIILPNTLFSNSYELREEGLIFFYSPGHSNDSSSCYDIRDNVLFVADNIDDPFPSFICWDNLNEYLTTLENYLTYNAQFIVQSHGPVTNNKVIKSCIDYLKKLIYNKKMSFSSANQQQKHLYNLQALKKSY